MVDGLVLVDDGVWVVTGGVDEAGLVVVGLVVEFVVFADGDVCVVAAEVDEEGLVVAGPTVEFVVGEDSSFEELAEAAGVDVVVKVDLVVNEEFVEDVRLDNPFSTDPVPPAETTALLS